MTNGILGSRTALWLSGALLLGVTLAAAHRALSFDIDFDPWEDFYG